MLSVKKNVQILVSALKSYQVEHIVLSPGSRNAPLIHTFASHPYFKCHRVVDERSAAFFALGIIQKKRKPVVVCCTSGTALLNYAPAIAEAYYQQLPLIVISADRSPAWIGQMDGQTIPQNNIFQSITKKSVHLPEIHTEEDTWYCERLIHEAILCCNKQGKGPVHINVPISEPLFDFSETELPEIHPIKNILAQNAHIDDYIDRWAQSKKRMIVIGQLEQDNPIADLIPLLMDRFDCVVLSEHLSNIHTDEIIGNFDALIYTFNDRQEELFSPDLLVSFGGHIVSKRLKQYLRKHKPTEHWHFSDNGNLVDLFQSLTDLLEIQPEYFLSELTNSNLSTEKRKNYVELWRSKSLEIQAPSSFSHFSDLLVVSHFVNALPEGAALHLANSSSVRNVQLYPLDSSVQVFCNRGTNGIDGSLSTATGFAHYHNGLVFLLIGDLSFFYDLNALCYNNIPPNMRILLVNNGGGAIFHQLPVPHKTTVYSECVVAQHTENAGKWIPKEEITYLSATNEAELQANMIKFVAETSNKPILFEVFTSIDDSTLVLKEYYKNLKK